MEHERIVADLHVHVDGKAQNKEAILDILLRAEKNGVKALCLLEHNNMNLYREDGILTELKNSGELEKIYSGKLIVGVEETAIFDDEEKSPSGYCYFNTFPHLLLYDVPLSLAEHKFFKGKDGYEIWKNDVDEFLTIFRKLKLNVPDNSKFKYNKEGMATQLYFFIEKDEALKKDFFLKVGEYKSKSDFCRRLIDGVDSKVHFTSKLVPKLTELFKFAKEEKFLVFLAHPARMHKDFIKEEYMEKVLKLSLKDKAFRKLDGVESEYLSNSLKETLEIEKFAKKNGLLCSAGSDFQYLISEKNPEGQMTYISPNNERINYFPRPGFYATGYYENGIEKLTMEKSTVDRFKDFKELF